MARIRSVHPSFFTDEAVVSCSPLARILYIGLWTDADDQGLFEWKPLQIKMRLLPGDAADVPALLAELVEYELVARLEAGGKGLGAIRRFREFQRPKKPNALFVLPTEWRQYVGLDKENSEPTEDEEVPVPNQFPTASEKAPQMEDGGGREGKEELDADASLSADADETKPEYPEPFEAIWKAYPHVKGRSSKSKSLGYWRRIPLATRNRLPSAIARYAREGREPKEDCGAAAMERWLRDGRYLDWLDDATGPQGPKFLGPDEVRAAVVAAKDEAWATSWLARCSWRDLPDRAVISANGFVVDTLRREVGPALSAIGVRVQLEKAA